MLHHLLELRARARLLLAVEHHLVPDVERDEEERVHQQPLRPEPKGPLERHAGEKPEEERRVPERRQ
jgi:hypothetical protein